MEAFLAHQRLVDDLLTDFAEEQGISSGALMRDLRDALLDNFTPLFQEHEYKWLAELLLCWNDYQAFSEAMEYEAKCLLDSTESKLK